MRRRSCSTTSRPEMTPNSKVSTTMLVTVILESASSDKFSMEVQERIAAGTLDLPTVASRCVQFDWSREQYVLDNGKLQQLTEVYVDPA